MNEYWFLIIKAVGLVFVLEGIMPFLSPDLWREMMFRVSQMSNRNMRIMGLCSMLFGMLVILILHQVI